MFLLISREPHPDFAYWPGRRVLAALDALAWPATAAVVVVASPLNVGAFGAAMFVVAAYLGVRRFCRALLMNQVTTWVWGKRLVALLSIGLLLKLALHVT